MNPWSGRSGGLIELWRTGPDLDISSEGEMRVLFDQTEFHRHGALACGSNPGTNYGIKSSDYINHWFVNTQMRSLLRMGAPLDSLFRFDLRREDAPRYRMLFVVNAFLLSPEEMRTTAGHAAGERYDGCLVLCTRVRHPDRLDLRQMEQLTGFTFSVKESIRLRCSSGLHAVDGAGETVEAVDSV